MIKKLRIKFVVINMSIVVLLLCVIFSLVLFFTQSNFETASVSMMRSIADKPFRQERPSNHGADVNLPFFVIQLDDDNKPTAINGGNYDLSDEEMIDEMLKTALSSQSEWGVIPEYNLRFLRQENMPRRCVVFADMSNETSMLGGLMRTCYSIAALSFLAFLIASILLSKWAVKPVDLAWKGQRQFVADASHELKTPLTVILTNAELLQNPDYSAQDKLRFSQNIIIMARKMRSLLCVANQGTEIPRSDLQNIFKRFYRIDQARVSDGSFGLGLSIAQSIACEHKGRIWANSKAQVNAFTVELPLAQQ